MTGPGGWTFRPLTPDTFADLEEVFAAPGCAQARGCWCIYYRYSGRPPTDPDLPAAEARRELLRAAVHTGKSVGILGYEGARPVGWVSFGPRADFAKLRRSPVMAAVDDLPVWSVICFVVPSANRRMGLTHALLGAAQQEAARRAVPLEAYPVHPEPGARDDSLWFGTAALFEAAGFVEVARPRPARSVMRWFPTPR